MPKEKLDSFARARLQRAYLARWTRFSHLVLLRLGSSKQARALFSLRLPRSSTGPIFFLPLTPNAVKNYLCSCDARSGYHNQKVE
jgi:hypothetical protein